MQPLPALPTALTHLHADAYVRACQVVFSSESGHGLTGMWLIDASQLQDFDSSALAALLEVSRLIHRAGGGLQMVGMPQRLRDLSALYGVSELLPA